MAGASAFYGVTGLREIRFNVRIGNHKESAGVDVILSNGTHEITDLLVGADGIHSRVRELSFGHEDAEPRPDGAATLQRRVCWPSRNIIGLMSRDAR